MALPEGTDVPLHPLLFQVLKEEIQNSEAVQIFAIYINTYNFLN